MLRIQCEEAGVAGKLVNVSLVQLLLPFSRLMAWLRSWIEKTIKERGWEVQNAVGAHGKALTWVLGIGRASRRKHYLS